jgi:hypothetical protein
VKSFHQPVKPSFMKISVIYVLVNLALSVQLLKVQVNKWSMLSQKVVEFLLFIWIFKWIISHNLIIPGYNMSRGMVE